MIGTFGLGLRAEKCFFWAFGIEGPSAENVDKSQGKSGEMAVFGRFFLGPWDDHIVVKNGGPCFLTIFQCFLHFVFSYTVFLK